MITSRETLPPWLLNWLNSWVVSSDLAGPLTVLSLCGDGSPRLFYRLTTPQKTWVLLVDPSWKLSADYPAHQSFLAQRGIRVPKFFKVDPEAGCLLMEDLGDRLLQQSLLENPKRKMEWLKQATLVLAQLHGKTFPVPKELPAATRKFDKQKYYEELLFTFEHLNNGLLKCPPLSEVQKDFLESYCQTISEIKPLVFTHRDYHTRNLMVPNSELVLIDFQDARLGPPHYDVASLIYDPYVAMHQNDRQSLLDLYRTEIKKYPKLNSLIAWDRFETDLASVGFQRVIKAAGSYASFFTRYQKTTHLQYLIPALETAQQLASQVSHLDSKAFQLIPLKLWAEKSLPWKLKSEKA